MKIHKMHDEVAQSLGDFLRAHKDQSVKNSPPPLVNVVKEEIKYLKRLRKNILSTKDRCYVGDFAEICAYAEATKGLINLPEFTGDLCSVAWTVTPSYEGAPDEPIRYFAVFRKFTDLRDGVFIDFCLFENDPNIGVFVHVPFTWVVPVDTTVRLGYSGAYPMSSLIIETLYGDRYALWLERGASAARLAANLLMMELNDDADKTHTDEFIAKFAVDMTPGDSPPGVVH